MSRTDKDKPHWVRAEWYEPWHNCGWYRRRQYRDTDIPFPWDKTRFQKEWTGKYEWFYKGDCDLPENPVCKHPGRYGRKRIPTLCSWSAEWTDTQVRYRKHKREWRRSEFHGPQRMNERLAEREAVKGNHEVEFPDGRGRHSVLWDMW